MNKSRQGKVVPEKGIGLPDENSQGQGTTVPEKGINNPDLGDMKGSDFCRKSDG